MSFTHGEKLELDLRPSRYLMGGLLLVHFGALIIIFSLIVQWWAIFLITIILLLSLIINIQKYVRFRFKKSICKISTFDGHEWTLTQMDEKITEVRIMGDSIVTHYLLILNFVAKNKKKYSVMILRDTLPSWQFKSLHLLLLNRPKIR